MPSDTRIEDKQDLGEAIRAAFAKPASGEGQLVPYQQQGMTISDAIITAQKVAVERDDTKVLRKIKAFAAAAGEDWYYRWKTKDKRTGKVVWVEGPSIKCANNVARFYGNCQVDTRVVDNGDTWIIYARFVDYETGFSYTRPFQQRKGQGTFKTEDAGRLLDLALQIGVSKAIRNVICNALETFTNYAFEEARNSIVETVGKDVEKYRQRVSTRLNEMGVGLERVEAVIGRALKDWLATDLSLIIAEIQAINDGMATVDETWPPAAGGAAPPRPTRDDFKEPATESEVTPEPFTVTDMVGDETNHDRLDEAMYAYHKKLLQAEAQGEKALTTVFDNNGVFFSQLEERGHAEVSRELSLEYGRLRESAALRDVPRGTAEPTPTDTLPQSELRSTAAAERQDASDDSPPPSTAHPGETSFVARETPPQTPSPAGPQSSQQKGDAIVSDQALRSMSSANASATVPTPAGDLPLPIPRDIKFWGRKNGSRKLLATDPDAFMGELPQRLAECRDWADTEDVERHNRFTINNLDGQDRIEVSGMFARRREELRGA